MRTDRARLLGVLGLGLVALLAGCETKTVTEYVYDDPRLRECMMLVCQCELDSQCPSPLSCVDGICAPYDGPESRLPPDTRPNGSPCEFGFQCLNGVCISTPVGGYCSEPCRGTVCPTGYVCEPIPGDEFGLGFCNAECVGGTNTPEVCNLRDDDCDKLIDEGFRDPNGQYATVENCGTCGLDCNTVLQHATGVACQLVNGSPTCVATACESGYFPFQGGIVCLPLPDNLCQPCTTEQDCLVDSSTCVSIAGGDRVCGRSCAVGSPYGTTCPVGYTCTDVGSGDLQCVPTSNDCSCSAATAGLERPCTVPTGGCPGLETCMLVGNSYEFGSCSADGLIPEICDSVDNDCDTLVDEGFVDGMGRYTSLEHCGGCNVNCAFLWSPAVNHATPYCDASGPTPTCRLLECVGESVGGIDYDWVDANGQSADGCECRRVAGNVGVDPPDTEFVDPFGNRIHPTLQSVYVDQNCDGIDGVIGDAIFVSASASPSGADGTLAHPFPTIAQGVAAFAAPGNTKRYVLVAVGRYAETVTLVAGLELHGGYASDFRSRNIVAYPTVVAPPAPAIGSPPTAAVRASGLRGPTSTIVSGFVLKGYDVVQTPSSGPGDSTYAVLLDDCDGSVVIENNRVVGGEGGRGANGTIGSAGFGQLSQGGSVLNGGNGANATPSDNASCPAGACPGGSIVVGGTAGTNPSCPSANGIAGGDAVCPVYPQPSWTPPIAGLDGDPGYAWTRDSATADGSCNNHLTEANFPTDIRKMDGGDGRPGASGSAGLQGNGCSSPFGSFVSGRFLPGTALPGLPGSDGQRGGAGAPSGGIDSAPAGLMPAGVTWAGEVRYHLGAGGGGAGAGGCGGGQGGPGGSGGASIAVLVSFLPGTTAASAPSILANQVERGLGGDGGSGGLGGRGGAGGNGGTGGNSGSFWAPFQAGSGGRGGTGGTGGGGGGGCGGASFGIAVAGLPNGFVVGYLTQNDHLVPDTVLTGGQAGSAGSTGQANAAADGAAGASQNVYLP